MEVGRCISVSWVFGIICVQINLTAPTLLLCLILDLGGGDEFKHLFMEKIFIIETSAEREKQSSQLLNLLNLLTRQKNISSFRLKENRNGRIRYEIRHINIENIVLDECPFPINGENLFIPLNQGRSK